MLSLSCIPASNDLDELSYPYSRMIKLMPCRLVERYREGDGQYRPVCQSEGKGLEVNLDQNLKDELKYIGEVLRG